jgi:hypothetical protein
MSADALHHFEKQAAARKIGTLAVDGCPFIEATHSLRAELAAEPIDIVHQHDFLHTEPRSLHRRSARRLITTDDEEIRLDDLSEEQRWQENERKQAAHDYFATPLMLKSS